VLSGVDSSATRVSLLTILVSHRLSYGHARLLIRVLQDHDFSELYSKSAAESATANLALATSALFIPAGHGIGELWVTVASQQLDGVGRHVC